MKNTISLLVVSVFLIGSSNTTMAENSDEEKISDSEIQKHLDEQKAMFEKAKKDGLVLTTFSFGYRPMYMLSNFKDAEKYYSDLLTAHSKEEAPKSKEYYEILYQRGLARKVNHNYEGALEDIEASASHLPDPEAALAIGRAAVSKDLDLAIKEISKLIEQYPDCSYLYLMKGIRTKEDYKLYNSILKKKKKRPYPQILDTVYLSMSRARNAH